MHAHYAMLQPNTLTHNGMIKDNGREHTHRYLQIAFAFPLHHMEGAFTCSPQRGDTPIVIHSVFEFTTSDEQA